MKRGSDTAIMYLHCVYDEYEEILRLPAPEARERFREIVCASASRFVRGLACVELLDAAQRVYQSFQIHY